MKLPGHRPSELLKSMLLQQSLYPKGWQTNRPDVEETASLGDVQAVVSIPASAESLPQVSQSLPTGSQSLPEGSQTRRTEGTNAPTEVSKVAFPECEKQMSASDRRRSANASAQHTSLYPQCLRPSRTCRPQARGGAKYDRECVLIFRHLGITH